MPTVVAESDLFASTFQRPNNGELADSASLLQFLQVLGNSRRYLYNRSLPNNVDATRFSVVGSGAVDDSGAINSAIAAAKTLGGGTVWLPAGLSYRCDSDLDTLDGRVALRAMKGTNGSNPTRLIRNFAGTLITVNNTSGVDDTPTLIEGFKFSDSNGNIAPIIDVTDGSLTLSRCQADGFAGAGPFIEFAGGQSSWLRLLECILKPDNGQSAVHHRIGQLLAMGCTFRVLGSTYDASYMVDVNSTSAFDPAIAHLVGNFFDASDQTVGDGGAVLCRGSFWDVTASGNTFQRSGQPFTAFTWAATYATARRIVESGNLFHFAKRHEHNGDPLTTESELSLGGSIRLSIGTPTVDCSGSNADSYGTIEIASSSATAPAITPPTAMVAGQRLRLLIRNTSAGSWAGAPTLPGTTFFTGLTMPTGLGVGGMVAVELEVCDMTTANSYSWHVLNISG